MQAFSALAGRVGLSLIFVLSGIAKISAYAGTQQYMAAAGVPGFLLPFVIALEVGGGLAILAGVFTRQAAVALALFSVASALLFHANLADQNQFIHFMKNIAMTGGLLQVVAFGAGAYSLDRRRVALPARSLQSRPSA